MEPINYGNQITLIINRENQQRFIANLPRLLQHIPENINFSFTIRAYTQTEACLSDVTRKLQQLKPVIYGPKQDQVQEIIGDKNQQIIDNLKNCYQQGEISTKSSIRSRITRFTQEVKRQLNQTYRFIHQLRNGVQFRECQSPTRSGVGRVCMGIPNESVIIKLERCIQELENKLNYQFEILKIQNGGMDQMEEQP